MNISSTPFIRNDYWPDYNDINQLNQRIDDVENEISLVNTRLSTDIENVSNNLNSYAKDQADTSISNNVIVNNLNANYAEGRFANFDNTFTNNAYIENLTVNKPVFDITLNTPHLENTTSLEGNFYNANLVNPNLVNPKFIDLDTLEVNSVEANTANIGNLFVNTNPEPISSSAVLGYDSEGRVIPIHATFDVGFPENADYLFTDHVGTVFPGVKATEVSPTDNLITAYAVKNAIDEVTASVNDNFNGVNDSLNNINDWKNTFENATSNSFNDVNNTFNDVNNTFNDVNNHISNTFANIDNNFNNSDNNFVNAANSFNDIYSILDRLISVSSSNAKQWNASSLTSQDFETIRFAIPADTTGLNISSGESNAVFAKVVGNELVISSNLPILNTDLSMLRVFNADMSDVFLGCTNLNQNILIPYGVTSLDNTFVHCYNLNQNILIPNSVTSLDNTFLSCYNLNQNILIPNNVTNMSSTFSFCSILNQNILIPNSVTNMFGTFKGCSYLNQNILIPNSVVDINNTFNACTQLNQNILIPNSVTNMFGTFESCYNLNQNILIPNSVTSVNSAFTYCYNLNQNILIPNSVTSLGNTFKSCYKLNQNILIPNSVTSLDNTFKSCSNFNQSDIYIYSQNINQLAGAFQGCKINNVHVPTSVPKDTSNFIYNCLVNGRAGITFPAANIFNDLPVDIEQWPPV